MEAVKGEERCRKSREARALQDLQQQMGEKVAAQAEMQVWLALLHSKSLPGAIFNHLVRPTVFTCCTV